MAQSFEYAMWTPHEKAKLYKRFTGDVPVELKDSEVITVQDNRYVLAGKFAWIETTSKEDISDQPIDGLIIESSYMTIKTNSLKVFKEGDIIMLPKTSRQGGLWIVDSGASTDYIYTPKQVQTYQFLPLSTVG